MIRVGEKVISRQKLAEVTDRILEMRAGGLSQQEVADRMGVDRTFISRLETLGEIRKGRTIAMVGFPVENRAELEEVARQEGVDFTFLLTDRERWEFLENKTGVDLFNQIMSIIYTVRQHDVVILLGSDMRVRLMKGLVNKEVIEIPLGSSPMTRGAWVDPERVRTVIRSVKTS
ncbi:MAG TPA: helix-turn-helix transcriptional regulator [Firmicutes bacterium]|nr:helix-turn-helix transcriptional regulator [Bacillota bacterium]